ncbi:hypothetical protein FisN_3Lh385 [Fistulifera solaris]|uniref:Plastid lipid-associated protein/fibrillin conserved domain-containing protein n=1 Tax=Fistulifera solaris TaxID=1519565 RepID=A0A1Z5J875_FISSO|nr:hypothetical protein FisN_3Lh385 [Fistulifera solaris]|eukprot:GAX10190.1 hypothetical protein FisN_3Lh385 [Fistulifera solaris]
MNNRLSVFLSLLVLGLLLDSSVSFMPRIDLRRSVTYLPSKNDAILECKTFDTQDLLKQNLLRLAASYDRGFGASNKAREEANQIIQDLERCNTEQQASRGMDGTGRSPLRGTWRMIWTTASDVLVLAASPVAALGAIYQIFEPPLVTNVIDFSPRVQALFPPNIVPSTVLRANVQTRAAIRPENSNRVGLVFEKVNLQPLQLFGQSIDVFPPLGLDLPKLPGTTEASSGPGYFDVTYLDTDLLIIRQNAPGGLFALIKVDSTDV